MDIQVEAEVKRLGLIIGFYTSKYIVEWAEKVIVEENEISEYVIFDIAAGANWAVSKMSQELRELAGSSVTYEDVRQTLFSLFLSEARNSLSGSRKVAVCLANLASVVEDVPELTSFKDQYEDLDSGIYGDETEIRSSVIEFLETKS